MHARTETCHARIRGSHVFELMHSLTCRPIPGNQQLGRLSAQPGQSKPANRRLVHPAEPFSVRQARRRDNFTDSVPGQEQPPHASTPLAGTHLYHVRARVHAARSMSECMAGIRTAWLRTSGIRNPSPLHEINEQDSALQVVGAWLSRESTTYVHVHHARSSEMHAHV